MAVIDTSAQRAKSALASPDHRAGCQLPEWTRGPGAGRVVLSPARPLHRWACAGCMATGPGRMPAITATLACLRERIDGAIRAV